MIDVPYIYIFGYGTLGINAIVIPTIPTNVRYNNIILRVFRGRLLDSDLLRGACILYIRVRMI